LEKTHKPLLTLVRRPIEYTVQLEALLRSFSSVPSDLQQQALVKEAAEGLILWTPRLDEIASSSIN